MSAWPDKFVIGLTGNIATGKSVVRRMLEHLGAYGIDADALAHRAMAKGAPGYQPVLNTFGSWILSDTGQIDRGRLGKIVFSDAEALRRLEEIIHPLVSQAVDYLVRHAYQPVVVIEAIKLIESSLSKSCDRVWVVYASPEVQVRRLIERRKMNMESARQRVLAQPAQEIKVKAAHTVIKNEGSIEDLWVQVNQAWKKLPIGHAVKELGAVQPLATGELQVVRARPRDAEEIAALINRIHPSDTRVTREEIVEAFGDKAFLLLRRGRETVGLIGWKVENLVSRSDGIFIQPGIPVSEALQAMLTEVERASQELQCEVSLLFVPPDWQVYQGEFLRMGYQPSSIEALSVRAWQEAARESQPADTALYYKKLRSDRVLRPI